VIGDWDITAQMTITTFSAMASLSLIRLLAKQSDKQSQRYISIVVVTIIMHTNIIKSVRQLDVFLL